MIESRQCYCGSLDKAFLEQQGIPEGYCGICELCGKPGHTQHYPGSVPYTGAWCHDCLPSLVAESQSRSRIIFCAMMLLILLLGGSVWIFL